MKGKDPISRLPDLSKLIFRHIRANGPIAKTELLKLPGMTMTTLNRFMLPLEENALIAETGYGESSGGRRPALFDVDRRSCRSIGIDISRTFTQIVVADLKAEAVHKAQFPMDESCTPERTVEKIAELIREASSTAAMREAAILGIGLGTVGPIDKERGIILNPKDFPAPFWRDVPIRDMIEKAVGIPAVMDNGANCAILAEQLFGSGAGLKNIAYFNCGIGIRAASISSGTIVPTVDGAEDAFAHMIIRVDGERCSCGRNGCIESYSGISAIEKKFAEASSAGSENAKRRAHLGGLSYLDICAAAEAGDAAATQTIRAAAEAFGTGVANYINLLNPGLVILSGPLIRRSALFYRTAVETAITRNYLGERTKTVFSNGGRFQDTATAVGAAALVVENLTERSL